jgi:hypothetical protein
MTTETTDKYIKHIADEGMVLTEWKEGDDILNFSYAKMVICPLNRECNWREITQEECDRLEKEQEERIKELNDLENGKNL